MGVGVGTGKKAIVALVIHWGVRQSDHVNKTMQEDGDNNGLWIMDYRS